MTSDNPKNRPNAPWVLVVDDDDSVREVARRLLDRFGVNVALADSDRSALDILSVPPGPIRLVLVDYSVVKESEDLMLGVRAISKSATLAMMSGYDLSRMKGLFDVPFEFLKKPFSAVELRRLVERCLFHGQSEDVHAG